MSVIDLIVGLLMLWAVFNGWRQGLILQLCSLAGIVLGAWLGIRFGTEADAEPCPQDDACERAELQNEPLPPAVEYGPQHQESDDQVYYAHLACVVSSMPVACLRRYYLCPVKGPVFFSEVL